ncbi:MAG: malonyl-ACP O-methyltransferase BioC [Steroidobacteraceae bacterium]
MSVAPRLLDDRAMRRNADRASATYDESAVLQAELRMQMIERLGWIAFEPATVLDLGCGTGHGAIALAARWPNARVIAVDFAPGMLREAARHDATGRCERLCADALSVPLPEAGVDLVFSNLLLPWCEDLDALFAEVARLLRPRGLFTFTTLGPDTLAELREACADAGKGTHVHPFTDMHDIGDGLIRAGLVEPVLDVSRYTLTYPALRTLMLELKATGAQNAAADRRRALTGRGRMRAIERAYERYRRDGVLPASCEVIFGQAWGAVATATAGRDGEFAFPVSDIGRREPRAH